MIKYFQESAEFKNNSQQSVNLLYTDKQTEKEIMQTTPFTITSNPTKYLRVTITKHMKKFVSYCHPRAFFFLSGFIFQYYFLLLFFLFPPLFLHWSLVHTLWLLILYFHGIPDSLKKWVSVSTPVSRPVLGLSPSVFLSYSYAFIFSYLILLFFLISLFTF